MKVAVVVPCYRVTKQILSVVDSIGECVDSIFVVDDCCPEKSGDFVQANCNDNRVIVLKNETNLGVGGAVIRGYRAAYNAGMDIIVKLDGDGQMDGELLPKIIRPIEDGIADYTKGSRFYQIDSLRAMPKLRLFGNAVLSFINKVSSGYWNIMDPTNGYTAIHRAALEHLNLDKINAGYFFESDMLFRLGTVRAVVKDIPIHSKYEDEISNLNVRKVALQFPSLYLKSFFKRVFYSYYLRDFNGASMELLLGAFLMVFGSLWGALYWWRSNLVNQETATGTVMIAVLPIILGFQLLLSAVHFDMANIPKNPIQSEYS